MGSREEREVRQRRDIQACDRAQTLPQTLQSPYGLATDPNGMPTAHSYQLGNWEVRNVEWEQLT